MRRRLKNHFIPHEGNDYKPHFVRERNLIGVGLLVIAIFGLAFSVKSLVTKNPDLLSAVITAVLVDLTNSNRLADHLNPLEFNPVLASAAQLKANDMAEKSYFAHNSPDGKTPWHWFKESGYDFLYAGENLAVNFVDSEDVVRAWMNSPGHRANILNGKFSEIGIAMASGIYQGRDSIFVVQLFGEPIPQPRNIQPTISTSETQSTSTPQGSGSSVSGAQAIAENVEVLGEDEMFIAVQNADFLEATGTEISRSDIVAQSTFLDRVITSPKVTLKVVYTIIGAIVLLALVLFVWIKPKGLHTKNVVYVVLLLLLVVALFYLSSAFLFPEIIVE